MSEHSQLMAGKIWDALGGAIFKGSITERIETVIVEDLNDLEETLLRIKEREHESPRHRKASHTTGYDDAIEDVLAIVGNSRG